jgi:mRNA interferase RelE/StbE
MEVIITKKFEKYIDKINDKPTLIKTEKIIHAFQAATKWQDIPNIKPMVGFKNFYRIRIGDFRIGIEIQGEKVFFLVLAKRNDIYYLFP